MTNVPGQQGSLDAFFSWLRGTGYRRDTTEKWFGGVCNGVARRWSVDPILLRVGMVLLALFTGFGALVYLVALALLPDQDGRIWAEAALRGRDGKGIALLVVVIIMVVSTGSDRHWPVFLLIPAAGIGWWILRGRRRGLTMEQLGQEAKDKAGAAFGGSSQPAPLAPQVPPPSTDAYPWGMPSTSLEPPAPTPGPWGPTGPQDPGGSAYGTAYGLTAPQPTTHGLGPGRTDVRYLPVAKPPRRRCAGFLGFLIVGGLSFVAAGAAVSISRQRGVAYSDLAVGGAAAVLATAVCLVALGLLGRRAPFLSFLALSTAALVAVAAALPPTFQPVGGLTTLGTQTWMPDNATTPTSASYKLGAGEATLNLARITSDADRMPVSAAVSMGELTVIVPAGLTVRVEASAGLGDVTERTLKPGEALPATSEGKAVGTTTLGSGAQIARTLLVGSGDPDVIVTAKVGLGEILVVRPDGTPITDLTTTGARS